MAYTYKFDFKVEIEVKSESEKEAINYILEKLNNLELEDLKFTYSSLEDLLESNDPELQEELVLNSQGEL